MSIKNHKPSAKSVYKQGYYVLQNPEKYVGDTTKIIYRSSWEYRFCRYCDLTADITCWSSEPIGIPYHTPFDKPSSRPHTYYVDFFMRVKYSDTETADYIIEVKPQSSVDKPGKLSNTASTKQIKAHNDRTKLWVVNQSKWNAAILYAQKMGYQFQVITEEFLYNKGV